MHTYPTRGLPAIAAEATHASRGYEHETGFCTVLEIQVSAEAPETIKLLSRGAGDTAQLAECLPGIHETLAFLPPHNPGMMAQAHNPSIREVEA